jgi:D-alanyl-lipoteichoic acid acyltransferase DltB (MBOAT superfamily)
MGTIADNLFYLSERGSVSVCAAWIGAVGYTLQIYFDFSGYSDMAIGLGHMFGFHFLENFNYPYLAKSITDFWRRWHISLSTWFRDYVYIPLGGNRRGVKRTYWNTFVVWLLTGIWHGANWTFIAWGLGYFVLLTIERIAGRTEGSRVIGRIYTLAAVVILWVVFRADSLSLAGRYISQMFGAGGMLWDEMASSVLAGGGLMLLVSAIVSFPVARAVADRLALSELTRKNIAAVGAIFLLLVCIAKCLSSAYNPFIYFNF